MKSPFTYVASFLLTHLGRLGYTTLLVLLAIVFVVDLVIPDPLPFVEEILLGLMTVTMVKVRGRKEQLPEGDAEGEAETVD